MHKFKKVDSRVGSISPSLETFVAENRVQAKRKSALSSVELNKLNHQNRNRDENIHELIPRPLDTKYSLFNV